MKNTTGRVEFEEVKLQLAKPIIDYLRRMYEDSRQWLEYYVVDWIRIDIETKTGEELIELFNLGPAFEKILG